MGPLTMEARRYALGVVLSIQSEINEGEGAGGRPEISLVNEEELARIEELIAANTWPEKWDGSEPIADELIPKIFRDGSTQALLVELEG